MLLHEVLKTAVKLKSNDPFICSQTYLCAVLCSMYIYDHLASKIWYTVCVKTQVLDLPDAILFWKERLAMGNHCLAHLCAVGSALCLCFVMI